jgi:F-type H+-transporting ATPase subunit b
VFYKIALTFGFLSLGLFASDGATDILPRTINFLIFAGIVYYLLGDKIKGFFESRTNDISNDLEEVQKVLRESKEKKEAAIAKLRDAEKIANDIIQAATRDSKVITEKMQQSVKVEMENLEKQQLELMELEKRRVVQEVAKEVLDELFKDGALSISNQNIIDIIKKKVA